MQGDILALTMTAAFIGVAHTLVGPDHYLPFVMMRRARQWTLKKTAGLTFLCGVGHVLGSVAIGIVGIVFGVALGRLEWLESVRGGLAAWMLLGFGIAYVVWGIRQAFLDRPHKHWHAHPDGVVHDHEHTHRAEHAHVHTTEAGAQLTPWVLFVIFVLGPCEALIPILMYPAYQLSVAGVLIVTLAFALATLATMMTTVVLLGMGLERLRLGPFERYAHAMAGSAMALCGFAIVFLDI